MDKTTKLPKMKYVYFSARFNMLILQCSKTWPYIDETFGVYYVGEL